MLYRLQNFFRSLPVSCSVSILYSGSPSIVPQPWRVVALVASAVLFLFLGCCSLLLSLVSLAIRIYCLFIPRYFRPGVCTKNWDEYCFPYLLWFDLNHPWVRLLSPFSQVVIPSTYMWNSLHPSQFMRKLLDIVTSFPWTERWVL